MDSTSLFTAALGLQDPWKVAEIRFEPEEGDTHFDLACNSKRLVCPACAAVDQSIHDRTQRTWQHLHFFQCKAFLHAPLPRVKCNQLGKVTQIEVPWARPRMGVDEKYVGRRLGYLSIFHDPLARRVIGTAEGRKADFVNHEGQPDAIEFITMDMSNPSRLPACRAAR